MFYQDSQLTIHKGDALSELQTMAAESIQCCVTSPPYYGLRDYGTGQWEGGNADCDHIKPITNYNKGFNERYGNGDGTAAQKQEVKSAGQYSGTCKKCGAIRTDQQIGMEETPEIYIAKLVGVFREVRRVLKDDGLLWVNIGDSYYNYRPGGTSQVKQSLAKHDGAVVAESSKRNSRFDGIKEKDLIGTPWMLAFALRADGWYLRSEIIWHKLNPMPESVTDRPTKAHEQIFLLSKSPKYFYDSEAVKEPQTQSSRERALYGWNGRTDDNSNGARTGSSFRKMAESGELIKTIPEDGMRNKRSVWSVASAPYAEAHFATFPPALIEPCILAGSRIGDTVIDCFGGSGTTAQVANKFGRKAVLIELNTEYCELAMKRNCQKTLFAATE